MTDAEDDPPVEGLWVVDPIAATSEALAREVERHQEICGELLPTLLLDQLAEWYVEARTSESGRAADADHLLDVLAEIWATGDDAARTAIATGFLEALPGPGQEGRETVEQLPTVLREQLRRMEDWRPSDG